MVKATFVKAAAKDYPKFGIKKGQSYWMWKFNFDPTIYRQASKPRKSQLTRSRFWSRMHLINDEILRLQEKQYHNIGQLRSDIEEISNQIDDLISDLQSSLDKTPVEILESNNAAPRMIRIRIDELQKMKMKISTIDVKPVDKEDPHSERLRVVNAIISMAELYYEEIVR